MKKSLIFPKILGNYPSPVTNGPVEKLGFFIHIEGFTAVDESICIFLHQCSGAVVLMSTTNCEKDSLLGQPVLGKNPLLNFERVTFLFLVPCPGDYSSRSGSAKKSKSIL